MDLQISVHSFFFAQLLEIPAGGFGTFVRMTTTDGERLRICRPSDRAMDSGLDFCGIFPQILKLLGVLVAARTVSERQVRTI